MPRGCPSATPSHGFHLPLQVDEPAAGPGHVRGRHPGVGEGEQGVVLAGPYVLVLLRASLLVLVENLGVPCHVPGKFFEDRETSGEDEPSCPGRRPRTRRERSVRRCHPDAYYPPIPDAYFPPLAEAQPIRRGPWSKQRDRLV